jgi:nucleoside-diphosphate-sugar epimerase
MARYLVTGGFGFVGSHLVEELYTNGHDIVVLDNLTNGQISNLRRVKNRITSYVSNVEQLRPELFTEKLDGIFHLATAPRSSSLKAPLCDIETNCKGMISVLELAKIHDAKVVFTSNSGIYGSLICDDYHSVGDPNTYNMSAIDENSDNNPTTPYDANKLASEYYCKIYNNVFGVKSLVVRFATVYGERQQVNEILNWRPLVATFVRNLVSNEQITINGDGEQTRDLIYVKDAVQGVIKAMESSINNADIFLLSTNLETSVNKVLRIAEDLVGVKSKVAYSQPLIGDIRRMRYDYSKAKNKLGFEPKFTIYDGIKNLIEYTKINSPLLSNV